MVAPLVGACSAPAVADPPTTRDRDDLYAASSAIWPSSLLTVCWEDTGFDDEKAWATDALQKSWEAETSISFIFVGQCSDASANLHVHFQDAGGVTNHMGKNGDGVTNDVNLNTWVSQSCVGGWSRERCVRSTAVHEFGHALGFAHEQNRGDTPATCTSGPQGPNGDTTVGDWDLGSVMDYCNPVRNGDARLSATDIWGAGKFYGARNPVALVNHDSSMEAFYRGTDNQLWHLWGNAGDWSGHDNLGNDLSSAPSAVSWGPGRMDVFARIGSDGHLEHSTWVPSGWAGWESLDRDGLLGAPVAVARGGNALDVFVRTTAGLSHRALDDSGWGGWDDLGNPPGVEIVGDPAAAAWSSDALEVFVRGTDSQLWHAWWRSDSGWSGWNTLGDGVITSNPAVVSSGPGSLEVFARGTDDAIWHIYYHGEWSGWESLGGVFRGAPAALTIGEGQMNVVAQGTDQTYHLRFDGAWGDWEAIAGLQRGSVSLATDGSRLGIAAKSSGDSALLYNDDLDVGPAPGGLGAAFTREKFGWRTLGGVIQ